MKGINNAEYLCESRKQRTVYGIEETTITLV